MSAQQPQSVNLLLVEDDEIDRKAFMRALQDLRIGNPVTVARDGVEAWDILAGESSGKPFPRPNIIITDINMPRMSGIELLRRIRTDDRLRDLIVFVLTTSDDDQDKIDAFNLNVAGYLLKSDMGAGFIEAVGLVNRYWRLVELPEGPACAA